eukprot:387442-Pleurochrysis_carterae.AAC.2
MVWDASMEGTDSEGDSRARGRYACESACPGIDLFCHQTTDICWHHLADRGFRTNGKEDALKASDLCTGRPDRKGQRLMASTAKHEVSLSFPYSSSHVSSPQSDS